MPCPHFDVKIIQRSKRQSAVASAAYQSGERLFSEYDQKQKYYGKPWRTVCTKRSAATALYLLVAAAVGGIVVLIGKI